MTKTNYIGWIPVVSGNLSFSEIGNTRLFKKFARICEIDNSRGVQTIALFGKRKLNDGVGWSWLRRTSGTETVFDFGLVCYSQKKGAQQRASLKGVIYFTDNRNVENRLVDFVGGNAGNVEKLDLVISKIKSDTNIVRWATFEILRNGQCAIVFDSRDDATEHIAQQFYFFLKDACHHHYHHNPKSDSITRAYLCSTPEDPHWRFETIYALHRSIVAARRYNSEKQLRMAIGISAYARSFEQRFLINLSNGDSQSKYVKDHGFEAYHFDEAIASIEVRIDEVKKTKTDILANIGIFIPVFLSILAICIGFSQIKAFESVDVNSNLYEFGKFAILHPFTLSLICATLIMCGQIIILRGSPISDLGMFFAKKIISRLIFLPRTFLITLLLLLSMTLFYFTFKVMLILVS